MILVCALVAQQQRSRVQLRHNQIRRAHRHPHPPQSVRAEPSMPRCPALARGSHPQRSHRPGCEIPSLEALPQSPQSPRGRSIHRCRYRQRVTPHPRVAPVQGQLHAFESPPYVVRTCDIAPQREPRRARVRDGNIHPAVLVEIQHRDADSRGQLFILINRLRADTSLLADSQTAPAPAHRPSRQDPQRDRC